MNARRARSVGVLALTIVVVAAPHAIRAAEPQDERPVERVRALADEAYGLFVVQDEERRTAWPTSSRTAGGRSRTSVSTPCTTAPG